MFSISMDVGSMAEKINVNIATAVRAAATQVYGKLIERSPVDTGYFRRNWQISVDLPATGLIGAPPASGATLPAPGLPDIDKNALCVWICNNVEYGERLNEGWSHQAPAGFVDICVAEVEAGMAATEVGL